MNICIGCGSNQLKKILDFGRIPISNEFKNFDQIKKTKKYHLGLNFCLKCYLVQNSKIIDNKKIFNKEYLYHSSYSKSWLAHVKKLTDYCIKRFKLNKDSTVLEIASNDGYLLKYFRKKKINSYGVEPSLSVAKIARNLGIRTFVDFFSVNFVKKKFKKIYPDIIIALNVFAHTPKIIDFVKALSLIMKKDSICIIEVPYLVNLIQKKQIDTIYHEHYSYFSLTSIQKIISKNKLILFDVELIETHGGSLRIFLKKNDSSNVKRSTSVEKLILKEKKLGLNSINFYINFSNQVKSLIKENEMKLKKICKNNKVIGYGAAAKATIMINLLRLDKKYVNYIFDQNRFKQSKFIPGTSIQIKDPSKLKKIDFDYMIIFVWNIKNEILKYLKNNLKLKKKFIIINPKLKIL